MGTGARMHAAFQMSAISSNVLVGNLQMATQITDW